MSERSSKIWVKTDISDDAPDDGPIVIKEVDLKPCHGRALLLSFLIACPVVLIGLSVWRIAKRQARMVVALRGMAE